MQQAPLATYFQTGSAAEIAVDLLGREVTYQSPNGVVKFLLTETEAYVGQHDQADHASWQKRAARNAPLWGPPGYIYVYRLRAQYLLNFITQGVDDPQGILIRGIEPTVGLSILQQNRPVPLANLTNGPGKLMQALGLELELNGQPLNASSLSLDIKNKREPAQIVRAPRIGVPNKGSWTSAPLRFYVQGNPFVSKIKRKTIDENHHGWQSTRNEAI